MNKYNMILISILFLFISCSDGIPFDDTESTLLALLDEDEATGLGGFDTGTDMDLDHDLGLEIDGGGRIVSDTLSYGNGYRIRFGRSILDRERSVEFETGEDTAIGIVSYSINGEFLVTAFDTSDMAQIDSLSFTKEFSNIFTRKIRFVKVDDPENPDGYRWAINALTPMVGGSGDKVMLTELSFYSLTDSLEVGELLYSYSSDEWGDMYINRESLPIFTSFSRVLVQASVINSGPEYTNDSTNVGEWVFLNYGKNRLQRGRRHLQDSGSGYDELVNDNIHTRALRVHGPGPSQVRGVFRLYSEVVDLATLLVSDGGYNTDVFSMPYKVERP